MIFRALIASILLGVPFTAAAQPAQLSFVLKQVGPGVYAAIDGPQHKAGSNWVIHLRLVTNWKR